MIYEMPKLIRDDAQNAHTIIMGKRMDIICHKDFWEGSYFTEYFGKLDNGLLIQFYPGPNAEYFSIMKGFERVNEVFKGMSLPFYIPKIGCGIGGLKWEHVEDVINLATTDIDVVVVEYKKC